jgi:hypothetical protein
MVLGGMKGAHNFTNFYLRATKNIGSRCFIDNALADDVLRSLTGSKKGHLSVPLFEI